MNLFDLAGTPCLLCVHLPLDIFDSMGAVHAETLEENTSAANFWELSGVAFIWHWNHSTAPAYREGLSIDNPIFGHHWTGHKESHLGWCAKGEPEEVCDS